MIRRFLNRLLSYKGRVKVGADKYGNSYYQKQEMKGGAFEWTSWLAGTRNGAPTPEEIAALEAYRENVKKMAALYEREEQKRSMKAKFKQQGVKGDDLSLEDMEVMMRQISGGEFQEEGAEKTAEHDLSHTKYTKVRDGKESTEPSVWQPPTSRVSKDTSKKPTPGVNPSPAGSTEGQGQGDSFEPGTWRP